jgi:Reverse transcriptase (RNA-dependent DNA polymerase)
MKIDFTKAFDSVSWLFLQRVMHARGFPLCWLAWIDDILSTSSSRVVLNGETTSYFFHKRGLWQGDPLSPMLFILAKDVLQKMVQAANALLQKPISPKIKESVMTL